MSLSNPTNPPIVNEAVAKTYLSRVLETATDENQTKVNQIHGTNPAGSTGAGIPKPVSNVSASVSNGSVGSTSTVNIRFQRDPSDKNFSGVRIYVKGYQGNNSPVQVGASAESPCTVMLNNTGESITLILQSVGNGGVSPIASSPLCVIKLSKNATGGFGTNTITNITSTQVKALAGGGTVVAGNLTASSVLQSTPLTVNLSTEGTFDWMFLTGYTGGTLSGTCPEAGSQFKAHWKLGNGRLLNNLRFLQNAQLAAGTDTSQFTYNSNSGDDAAYNETVNPAKQPLASRAADPFWFGNNNNLFFYPFGFQWRDIPLPTMAARTLKFYVYLNNATVTLTARLSDGSAADVSAVMTNGSTAEYVVTVNVTPGSFGATLNVSLMVTSFSNSASRVGISAVTMA